MFSTYVGLDPVTSYLVVKPLHLWLLLIDVLDFYLHKAGFNKLTLLFINLLVMHGDFKSVHD